ncbi:ribosome quality control complex subunit NEMF-like [Babylonia areolata]|uniref:ribosome quality control complex subunit NEMF-like n=1 Tax=Babylonia areolata TaxID=304850 RepID=UPI003FD20708
MKGRFSTLDIGVIVKELKRLLGMRVVNVYDIDNKTYLIRIARPDEKAVLLLESGIRLHSTGFDWPKNPAPSGFSMKMRKHLKGRRFEKIEQLGVDRIVDLQFGSGEAAYHVILELYDRGNIVLTDWEYTILNILRPRTDNSQDVRFAVREQYPVTAAKHHEVPTEERLLQVLQSAKTGDSLRRTLVPHLDYGPAVLDHCLLEAGFPDNVQIGKGFSVDNDMQKLMTAIQLAETLMTTLLSKPCKGYIIQKVDKKPNPKEGESAELAIYDEYHPFLFKQMARKPNIEFDIFDKAVDEFFSKLESQKLDVKVLQQEKAALKKLDNVKKDHERRINELQKVQDMDIMRGQLIEMNLELVDKAILIVRSALANQIDWTEISQLVKEAQATGDPVAKTIVALKLDTNHITMLLQDPYEGDSDDEEEYAPLKPMKVDIDLGLSSYANSRKFFDKKKQAAKKEQKTMEASNKALKSAEKKTKETLKDMATVASINKTRKTYWFEKFLWFISSENYLVIGGRDQQQNELLVKRYLKPGDLYVHADLHGASSVILKNPTGGEVPPKTLNEAGTMAICNSAAWDAKVVTSAWWVCHDQVSKTAPSGEYLTTGSFMIRGKKNYLPPSYLIYGFGFLFRLEDGSVERHAGERRVRTIDDDAASVSLASEAESLLTLEDINEEDNENDAQSDDSGDENQGDDKDAENGNMSEDSDTEQAGGGDHDEEDDEGGEKTLDREEEDVVEEAVTDGSVKKKAADVPSGFEFPDTSINLTHVEGDRFSLQRLNSVNSTTCSTAETDDAVYLGDDSPVTFGEKNANRTSGRLSAKQRREMRKAKKGGPAQEAAVEEREEGIAEREEGIAEREEGIVECEEGIAGEVNQGSSEVTQTSEVTGSLEAAAAQDCEEEEMSTPQKEDSGSGSQQMQPPKRGQKGKLRRKKEKYRHQDEEERKQKMDLLASSGSQKEEKRKKGKKGKEEARAKGGKQTGRPQSGKGQGQGGRPEAQSKAAANDVSGGVKDGAAEMARPTGFIKEEPQDAGSDGEHDVVEEENQPVDDMQILNALTGLPVPDDELLYAIPCCAPYNALTAYKFKVKLLPGTTKRGKAAKTALNMFQHDKAASVREKDLLRIMKDADLSRNMPGKVKVAAPNLHKR